MQQNTLKKFFLQTYIQIYCQRMPINMDVDIKFFAMNNIFFD